MNKVWLILGTIFLMLTFGVAAFWNPPIPCATFGYYPEKTKLFITIILSLLSVACFLQSANILYKTKEEKK